MAEATDNAISPDRLFQISYCPRGKAAELAQRIALSRYTSTSTSTDPFRIQTVIVDAVTDCGPRQFGWTDTKSALNTLVSWLNLSMPLIAGDTAEEEEIQLDCGRIRQFAKTIIGGACQRNGSYQDADDSTLGPLEDWLRQSFILEHERSTMIGVSLGIQTWWLSGFVLIHIHALE